jgi:hypothetical protein
MQPTKPAKADFVWLLQRIYSPLRPSAHALIEVAIATIAAATGAGAGVAKPLRGGRMSSLRHTPPDSGRRVFWLFAPLNSGGTRACPETWIRNQKRMQ